MTALLTLGVAAPPTTGIAQQDTRPGLAVLPFENGGSYGKNREDYEALRKGIAGLMISELHQQNIRVVDRAETNRVLDEQALASSGRVDASTAARVGQLVGARYMITGTFIDLYGDFRLDARIIDVETGEILKTVRSNPDLKDIKELDRIINSVATRILAESPLPALPSSGASSGAGAAPVGEAEHVPTEALILYSRALLYEDDGKVGKAIEYYQKALDQFPSFPEAQEGLKKARNSQTG